jgi:hypothetical protein
MTNLAISKDTAENGDGDCLRRKQLDQAADRKIGRCRRQSDRGEIGDKPL